MTQTAAQVTAPSAEAANLLKLVATYCGVQDSVVISVAPSARDVEFSVDGAPAFGLNSACRYIASFSPAAAQLLGQTPEQQAKIAEWLAYRHTELTPLMDDKLAKVNEWLQSRTYLCGAALTLADLVLYATVQPAACAFPVAQHLHFANLLRWYDWVHHTADRTAIFPPATFAKPRFVAPPSPPPAQAKGEAQQGGKAAAADKKADGKKAAPAAASAAAAPAQPAAAEKAGKKAAAAAAPAADGPAAGGDKKEGKKKGEKGAAAPAAAAAPAGKGDDVAVDMLDIRVGQIVKVDRHPNADALYVEEIDVGEEKPRQIVSGLVKFVPQEKMEGRRVVVLLNLKPAKMRDVMSYGMVLCASNAEHTEVDPINPPEGVPVGERVTFEGYGREPEAQLNPKKKIFERIAPDLITDANGLCTYKGVPFMTSKGPCTATIPGAHIA